MPQNTYGQDITKAPGSIVPVPPIPTAPKPISIDALTRTDTPIAFNTYTPAPPFSVASLGAVPDLQMTAPETEASKRLKEIAGLNEQTAGESAYRAEQETALGIPQTTKTISDLTTRLNTLKNEALAIPLQLQNDAQGKGVTAGGLQPIQDAMLRNNAIQALSVNSLLEAAQGNLNTALNMVDRAVAQRFDPIKERIAIASANLQLILQSPEYSLAEKNRAQRQLTLQQDRQRALEKMEADQRDIFEMAVQASARGADALTTEKIQKAGSVSEALSILTQAGLGQDPKTKLELELLRQEIAYKQKQRSLLGEPTAAEKKALEAALKQAQTAIPVMQDKIMAVDTLVNHPGLNSRVGTGILSRGASGPLGVAGRFLAGAAGGAVAGAAAGAPFAGIGAIPGAIGGALIAGTTLASQGAVDNFTGAGQDFAGGVHKLTAGLTLDALIEAKERGATFGALEAGERVMLANSATAINDWEEKKDGIGTGYWDIDEASFIREMKVIQDMTRRALQRSQGTILTPEEQEIINGLERAGFSPEF